MLNTVQEAELRKLMIIKNPLPFKLPFAPWNVKVIQWVIFQRWLMNISISTVIDYMKHWGLTALKSIEKAYEQSQKAVVRK